MGLTLESFRNGIQVASAGVTGAGSKNGFLVYSEAEKGGLKLDLSPQTASQSDREFNIYVRSQLLSSMRDAFSASNRSGKAVDDFMAKAEKMLFGPLDDGGRYGVDTATRKLECATVKKLLDEFDSMLEGPPTKDRLSVGDKNLLKKIGGKSYGSRGLGSLGQMLDQRRPELIMNERQIGVFKGLKSQIPDLKVDGIASDGKSVLCKGNGPDGPCPAF